MSNRKDDLNISVVIVNYNTKELLGKFINSIKERFNGVSYEIIVVDNNSKDGSIEMLEKEFPDVRLIRNSYNVGVSKASNQGIKVAKANYVLLANSDVKVVSDSIKDLIDYMEKNPKVGVLGPKIYLPGGNIQASARIFQNLFTVFIHLLNIRVLLPADRYKKFIIKNFKRYLGETIRGYLRVYEEKSEPELVDWVVSAFILIRKEVLNDVGYWDEDFFISFDEEDFQLRAHRAGWKAVYYPRFEIIHREGVSGGGASGKDNPLLLIEKYRSQLIYWCKHHPDWKVLIVRIIMLISFGVRYLFCQDKDFKKAYRQILKYSTSSINYIKSHGVLGS